MALTKAHSRMIEGDVANVLDFGASTTNTATQNKAAFEAALATGKKVYIPEGTFNIEDVQVPDNSHLTGAGMYLTILRVTSGENGLVSSGGWPTGYVTINMSDFTIESEDGYSTGAKSGFGIVLESCVDSSFNNILVMYFEYGFYVRSSWDLNFPLIKFYNCRVGFKVPRIGVDGNASFNSTSFGTFVSEANTTCGMSLGYGANISIQAAQVENQLIGFYMAEVYFIDVGTTYWEWSTPSGSGEYVYLIGQDEAGDHGYPKHLNIRNIMTSTYQAGVGVKNSLNVYFSGELRYQDFVLSGNTSFNFDGIEPKPKFSAYRDSDLSNVTGDGTAYTVVFDVPIFNAGAYYNESTGVFTAPFTGIYRLTTQVYAGGMIAAHDNQTVSIVTSNRTYTHTFKTFDAANVMQENPLQKSVLVDMDAGDTAYVTLTVTGTPTPTKIVDIFGGSSTNRTMFCGEFVGFA